MLTLNQEFAAKRQEGAKTRITSTLHKSINNSKDIPKTVKELIEQEMKYFDDHYGGRNNFLFWVSDPIIAVVKPKQYNPETKQLEDPEISVIIRVETVSLEKNVI